MKKDSIHPIHRFYDLATDNKVLSTATVNLTLPVSQQKLRSNHLSSVITDHLDPVIKAHYTTQESKLHKYFFCEYEDALKNMESATPQDLSYRVDVRFVDLNQIMPGVRHSYSESDRVIKYSKEEHSPVSSKRSDVIQLGTPCLYEGYEQDSGLIGDDLEGKYKEHLNWWKQGSEKMEVMKKSITDYPFSVRNQLEDLNVTWENRDDFWLYCTSIDPQLSRKRKEQMKKTDPEYNFITKIENPAAFAEQLGHDFGKQIEGRKDLKCNIPGLYVLFSTLSGKHGRGSGFFILVEYGPIIYLDGEKKQEFINYASERTDLPVMLFVKDLKYELQQEYRFVIKVAGHSPKEDKFCLKVSEDIRELMLPM